MISLRKYTSATNFPQITAGGKEELQALVQALSLNLITMPSPSSLRTSGERIDIIFPTSGSQSVYVRPAFLSRTAEHGALVFSRPRSLKVFLCPTLRWQIRCLAVVVILYRLGRFPMQWKYSYSALHGESFLVGPCISSLQIREDKPQNRPTSNAVCLFHQTHRFFNSKVHAAESCPSVVSQV